MQSLSENPMHQMSKISSNRQFVYIRFLVSVESDVFVDTSDKSKYRRISFNNHVEHDGGKNEI